MPKLDKRTVDAFLRQPGEGERTLWDSEIPGFGLRVRPGRKPGFVFVYRHEGRSRRKSLGVYTGAVQAARKAARAAYGLSMADADPNAERVRQRQQRQKEKARGVTFDALSKRWLDKGRAKWTPKGLRNYENFVKRLLEAKDDNGEPFWRGRIVADIRPSDVARWYEWRAPQARVAVNREWDVLKYVLDLESETDVDGKPLLLPSNPARSRKLRKEGIKRKEEPRTRTLLEHEYALFARGLASWPRRNGLDREAAILFELILECGCRKGELIRLPWAEVTLHGRRIDLPASRRKNATAHTVYLSDRAVELLQLQKSVSVGGLVFPIIDGKEYHLDNRWRRFRTFAGLEGLTLHDLRRSHSETAGEIGGLEARKVATGDRSESIVARHYGTVSVSAQREYARQTHERLAALKHPADELRERREAD